MLDGMSAGEVGKELAEAHILDPESVSSLNEQQCICLCNKFLMNQANEPMYFEINNLPLLTRLLENNSFYVSYCARNALLSLFGPFISQPDDRLKAFLTFISQQISRYTGKIADGSPVNDLALLHILDLALLMFGKDGYNTCDDEAHAKHILKQWKILFDHAFSCQNSNKASLFNSTLKLYIKIVKNDINVRLTKEFRFEIAQYILVKMKCKEVPGACVRKTLMLLYHCCPDFNNEISYENKNLCIIGVSRICLTMVKMDNTDYSVGTNTGSCCNKISWMDNIIMRSKACCLFIGQGNLYTKECHPKSCDFLLLRAVFLVISKCGAFLATHDSKEISATHDTDKAINYWETDHPLDLNSSIECPWKYAFSFILYTTKRLFPHGTDPYKQLITLFCDQDDEMINFMLFALHSALTSGNDTFLSSCHHLFLEMLVAIQWNHFVLIDWLISPETVFLQFLLKQLKCIIAKPQQWLDACHVLDCKGQDCLDKCAHGKLPGRGDIEPSSPLSFTENCCNSSHKASHCNLTAYSDSDDSQDEQDDVPLSSNESHNNLNHTLMKDLVLPKPACITYKKAKNTLTSTAAVIEKLMLNGNFPYNPAPLLRLLRHFNDC